jgi:uncharacterized protein (TIGR02246 family)
VSDEQSVRALYAALIGGWNARDASVMSSIFADDANLVGFDGSQIDGGAAIEESMRDIFEHHKVPPYIVSVREVRFLTPSVAILRAVAGMIPDGHTDINPALNAIQTLVAVKIDGGWKVSVFHNTPAAFHGRPELAEQLTQELRQLK